MVIAAAAGTINSLPQATLPRALEFLPLPDIASSAACGKLLRAAATSEVLWRALCVAAGVRDRDGTRSWRATFRTAIRALERGKFAPDQHDAILKTLIVGEGGVGKTSFLHRFADRHFVEPYACTQGIDFHVSTVRYRKLVVKLQMWDTAGQERYRRMVASYYRGAHGVFLAFDLGDRSSFIHLDDWLEEIRHCARENIAVVVVGTKLDRVFVGDESPYEPPPEPRCALCGGPAQFVCVPCGHECGCRLCLVTLFQNGGACPVCDVRMRALPKKSYWSAQTDGRQPCERAVTAEEGRTWAAGHGHPYVECSARTGEGVDFAVSALLHEIWKREPNPWKPTPAGAGIATSQPSKSTAGHGPMSHLTELAKCAVC